VLDREIWRRWRLDAGHVVEATAERSFRAGDAE
jgi:hypothetical protein